MSVCMVRKTQAVAWRSLSILRSSLLRTMSDHLDRTAHSYREPGVSEAEVVSIQQASETVRLLTLKVDDPKFTFKAGQWVDFFIPGIEIFTGYSMCSSPSQLTASQTLDLAVKISDYPPTMWVHEQCTVGSKVHVRAGGDQLIFDPQPGDPSWNVLLIAGGIGINPLVSMLHHTAHLHDARRDDANAYTPGKVEMLFSAASKSELIFKDTIEDLASKHPSDISAQFFVTRESMADPALTGRRIGKDDVKASIQRLKGRPLRCFICGPPPMIADMEAILHDLGVSDSDVLCEKWW
ncbi:oxidoreductase NAD-binding domain-containing protein 1-like [Diadema setosum]|uniref:oxidoreductase NAD-binding domain-containing protein 1-like n=1 Tax=Diadema setosum TaxID=31175 RepID=UPI003B3AB252